MSLSARGQRVVLVVVTNDAAVARWAAAPISMGHPGWALTPLVIGPTTIPAVRDKAQAIRAPELALLSVIVHGKSPEAADIGRNALAALAMASNLDDDRVQFHSDLVVTSVHKAARAIEGLMANRNYEYQSDFAKRFIAEGRTEGRTQGLAEGEVRGEVRGRAHAVLGVLAARCIAVTDLERERILGCSDLVLLDAWLLRAVVAASIAEVLGE